MKIKNIIELYDWDKEFDYEELAKLKENLQLLIDTGIYEFLEKVEHKWTMSKDYKSTANFGMLYEEVGMLYEELEGNQ